jgi:hypothetical protein
MFGTLQMGHRPSPYVAEVQDMRLIRALLSVLVSMIVAGAVAYVVAIRPRLKWGVDPQEAELPIPGDDLIAEPSATETRGVTIDAPVAAVWPWLVQMGYERGGWYSYDGMDSRHPTATEILPEFQNLAQGDIMPTHPGGGFRVAVMEPERALVLFTDTDLVREQAERAAAEGRSYPGAGTRASYPEFAASWAFLLEPTHDGKTRLIERFRARTPGAGPARAVMGEIMGTGMVLMTRKQMIGIKERVERLAAAARKAVEATPSEQLEPTPVIGT